jgi:hypothetical protein
MAQDVVARGRIHDLLSAAGITDAFARQNERGERPPEPVLALPSFVSGKVVI